MVKTRVSLGVVFFFSCLLGTVNMMFFTASFVKVCGAALCQMGSGYFTLAVCFVLSLNGAEMQGVCTVLL